MTATIAPSSRRTRDPSPDATGAATSARAGGARVAARAAGSLGLAVARPLPDTRPPTTAPDLEVVPRGYVTPRSRRRRRRLLGAASFAGALGVVFGLVAVHVELTANQLRLTTLQSKADLAQEQYLKLRLEVAQLQSPARVVATAQGLGMVPPSSITYLRAEQAAPPPPAVAPAPAGDQQSWAAIKRANTRQ